MKKLSLFALLGWIFLACSSPSHELLLSNVNVIDVVTGEVLPNRTVAIDGDEITAIYTKIIKPQAGTEVVDGTGKYLIPGLWDMHVHNNWNYEDTNDLLVANGVVGAREMWGDMEIRKKMYGIAMQKAF
ncbi:amidohydrolase [Indibacter alkaliphilus]|uniref:amidohydrolase n=1 Tax=Indibacter alkaliphilus TaxID=579922 RepID=UPI00028237F3|nr:amidohydrolase [Indibacter alkaliphilus]